MSERYEISTDPARMQIDEIWGYLRGSYWSPDIRREVTQRAVENSICVGAFEKASGRQIGFARAHRDRLTHEDAQSRDALGRPLLSSHKAYPDRPKQLCR